jgi:hypothetical protein
MDVEESRVYKTTWFGILIHPSMSWIVGSRKLRKVEG